MGVGGQHHAPAALPPRKTRYSLHRRLGRPQGRSGRVRKISPPPGFDPQTVQPVASRYTYWANNVQLPVYLLSVVIKYQVVYVCPWLINGLVTWLVTLIRLMNSPWPFNKNSLFKLCNPLSCHLQSACHKLETQLCSEMSGSCGNNKQFFVARRCIITDMPQPSAGTSFISCWHDLAPLPGNWIVRSQRCIFLFAFTSVYFVSLAMFL